MKKELSPLKAISVFLIFTIYFYLLLYTIYPFVKSKFSLHPTVYWFIIGYCLFIPIFATALIGVYKEGNRTFKSILKALNIKKINKKDGIYTILGLIAVFFFTGNIFGISFLLHKVWNVPLLETTPWFMEIKPMIGTELLLLFVWLPMFFFNIVGEELLWRGYIQNRLKIKHSWILISFLWLFFHIPFGLDMLIMILPAVIIVPLIFHKTKNTSIGILIHGIFNGPTFIAVALGLID